MTETIKQTVANLLKAMDFGAVVDIDSSDQKNIMVNIQTDEAGFLIGQAGANLQAFQHLAKVVANKKLGFPVQFTVDVNDYQKHRVELLKELAGSMAKQAIDDKAPLFLQPMPPNERRIVHLALADHPQVDTESIGQEPGRRIVIKLKGR